MEFKAIFVILTFCLGPEVNAQAANGAASGPVQYNSQQIPAPVNPVPPPAFDLTRLEKDMPDVNLYHMAGDWILRGNTAPPFYYTRLSIKLEDNTVIAEVFKESEAVSVGMVEHVKDSKAIESNIKWNNSPDLQKFYFLSVSPKVSVLLMVLPNGMKALQVLAKNCEPIGIEEIKLIITKLMSKQAVREVIKDLVPKLLFVNHDIPPTNYRREEVSLSDGDIEDFDLTRINELGQWTLMAATPFSDGFNCPEQIKFKLSGNKVIGNLFDAKNQLVAMSSMTYLKGTKIINWDVYSNGQHFLYNLVFVYTDSNAVVVLVFSTITNSSPLIIVWSLSPKPEPDYLRRVIDNYLLFSHDTKRTIKDMVPKLVWKSNNSTQTVEKGRQ